MLDSMMVVPRPHTHTHTHTNTQTTILSDSLTAFERTIDTIPNVKFKIADLAFHPHYFNPLATSTPRPQFHIHFRSVERVQCSKGNKFLEYP
jgi:hypothetical protein